MSESLKAVQADADNGPDGVVVTLTTENGEFEITVPPAGRWKARASSMLASGDIDGWVDIVLSDEDVEQWDEADPTNDETQAFFELWGERSGENVGKSRASSRSSKRARTRKR